MAKMRYFCHYHDAARSSQGNMQHSVAAGETMSDRTLKLIDTLLILLLRRYDYYGACTPPCQNPGIAAVTDYGPSQPCVRA